MAAKLPHEVHITRSVLLEAQANPSSYNLDAARFEYEQACAKHGLEPEDLSSGEHFSRQAAPVHTGLAAKVLKLWRK